MNISSVKQKIKAYKRLFLNICCSRNKVDSKLLYFSSYHGLYCDSPKLISEEIHRIRPDVSIVWECSDVSNNEFPSYIKRVKPNSFESIKLRSKSKIIIDNYLGWYSVYANKGTLKSKIFESLKRHDQFNISTWHGMPIKKINLDEPSQVFCNDFYSSSDLLLCGNLFMQNLFYRINYNKIPTILIGTPRNDTLINWKEENREKLLNKLNLPSDNKYVLYAPTFRDNVEMSGFKQLKSLDINNLLITLEHKFGGSWCLIVRLHNNVLKYVMKDGIIDYKKVFPGNITDEMSDYMCIADVMITDYSSCIFDYMLLNRPCFLFCPDLESYVNNERGLYFQMSELPYSMAVEEIDLINNIKKYDEKTIYESKKVFLDKIGNVENGTATNKCVNIILDKLENGGNK